MAESTDGDSYQGALMYPATVLPQDHIKLISDARESRASFPASSHPLN